MNNVRKVVALLGFAMLGAACGAPGSPAVPTTSSSTSSVPPGPGGGAGHLVVSLTAADAVTIARTAFGEAKPHHDGRDCGIAIDVSHSGVGLVNDYVRAALRVATQCSGLDGTLRVRFITENSAHDGGVSPLTIPLVVELQGLDTDPIIVGNMIRDTVFPQLVSAIEALVPAPGSDACGALALLVPDQRDKPFYAFLLSDGIDATGTRAAGDVVSFDRVTAATVSRTADECDREIAADGLSNSYVGILGFGETTGAIQPDPAQLVDIEQVWDCAIERRGGHVSQIDDTTAELVFATNDREHSCRPA